MEHWGVKLWRLIQERGFKTRAAYAKATGIDGAVISKMVAGNYYNPRLATSAGHGLNATRRN